MGSQLSLAGVHAALPCQARLSFGALQRRDVFRENVEDSVVSVLMERAEAVLNLMRGTGMGILLKGGGAIWWHAVRVCTDPGAGQHLPVRLTALGLLDLHDLDFCACDDMATFLPKMRQLCPDLSQVSELALTDSKVLDNRVCRVVPSLQDLSFTGRERSGLGNGFGHSALSVHKGANTATGEDYQLVRLSVVIEHRRGFLLRCPYVDISTSCPGAQAGGGLQVLSLERAWHDIARMLFSDTRWKPWRSDRPEKLVRRMRRMVGVTLMLDHPASLPWRDLADLLDYIWLRESQLRQWQPRETLRELRRLGRGSAEYFQAFLGHVHMCLHCALEDFASDEEYEAFLFFIDALSAAAFVAGECM